MHELKSIAGRLKGLREMMDISISDMARSTEITEEDYTAHESGEKDFSFTFLLKASKALGVDITDLITGESPKLSLYEVVRKGKGLPIHRREGFDYQHLAYLFKNKMAQPFVVRAKYDSNMEKAPIALSSHEGQELDYVLSGSIKIKVEQHEEILHEGDSIYYDSGKGHGMVAIGGEDAVFIAVVIDKD